MPNHTTTAPPDKGASDNVSGLSLSELQTQLSKHETYHARVRAINAALRSARIDSSASDSRERVRGVLRSVLGDERLVEMYERQLRRFSRGRRSPKFPTSVLTKNNMKIRQLCESIADEEGKQ
jgi:hypothetical protein